jgi:hypothetical protein
MTAEAWHRRHAIQIAAALPEDAEDALLVLELAKQLVEGFLAMPQRPDLSLLESRARGGGVAFLGYQQRAGAIMSEHETYLGDGPLRVIRRLADQATGAARERRSCRISRGRPYPPGVFRVYRRAADKKAELI